MEKTFTVKNTNMAKGFAILLLLLYHLFETEELVASLGVNYAPLSLNTFLMFSRFGNICVAVFVFLTAFGISNGLMAQGEITIKETYAQAAKRLTKLMANFAVLYLSVNLLWWYKFDYGALYGMNKQGIVLALTDALGLSQFFDTPTLNMTWWYMEVAYLLILLVPVLNWLVKKTGNIAMLLICFLPFVVTLSDSMQRYLLVAVFGVCAAHGKWLDRLKNQRLNPLLQWVLCIAGFIVCVMLRQNYIIHTYYIWLTDAPIALFLIYFAGVVMGRVPVLRDILAFIGKHSRNIFLIHTFFYQSLWQQFIYRFRYAGITFLLLLITSLLYSMLLEFIKQAAVRGYGKLSAKYFH